VIYSNILDKDTDFCNVEQIVKLDNAYEFLGNYRDLVINGANGILNNEKLFIYGKTVCEYVKLSTTVEARCIPLPKLDGTIEKDVFAALVMITLIPDAVELYKKRGYSVSKMKAYLGGIDKSMATVEKNTGRPAMTDVYYNWTLLYFFGEIFECGSFEFQLTEFNDGAIILKNKDTGEFISMMTEGKFHKSGLVLGSIGAESEEGSFEADFFEDEEVFIGNLVNCGKVSPEKTKCNKADWERVLSQKEYVLAVHIPKDADISHQVVTRDFEAALKLAKKEFPNYELKFIVCYSWLLDPTLESLLGSDSRLVGFGKEFLRFPVMSNGTEYKMFVFPSHNGETETLPEDTSLQRKIKELLLSDGYIYYTGGVCTEINGL